MRPLRGCDECSMSRRISNEPIFGCYRLLAGGEELVLKVSGGGESFLQRGFEHGEMPHFASGSSFAFAVKMQLGVWLGEDG